MSDIKGEPRPTGLHIIDVRLESCPDALYRLLGVVRRYNCTVEHLVACADDPNVSRATLVIRVVEVGQMVRQIKRLVSVLSVATPHSPPSTKGGAPSTTTPIDRGADEPATHTEDI